MIYWGGGRNFLISHYEKCITNLPLLLQFQIIFFSTKRHSQNNYSSISDYFLSNLTTKRLSNKKEEKKLGVFHVHKRERDNFIDLPVE